MVKASHRSGRKCPNGHSMDPNWVSCPYCEAEEKAKQKSNRPAAPPPPDRDRTRVGTVMPEGQRGKTKIMNAGAAQAYGGPVAATKESRKITGVLVTYSWLPEGELFVVREGKNFIGRSKVASDASHQNCDIQVSRDKRMSGEHALILCRQGALEIIDRTSANGTFLNDTLLKANESNPLPERATIKTGDTLWSFIQIRTPPGPIGKSGSEMNENGPVIPPETGKPTIVD